MQAKQVLLTGGTGGLGQGVIPVLLAQGAELTVPYRRVAKVEPLKKQRSPAELARLHFVEADLSDEAAVAELVEAMPRVDALIHLVGGFSMGKTHTYDYSDWKKAFNLNLDTTFLVCKQVLQRMLAQNYGRIVTIGSRGAAQPAAQLAAYSAAKAGVVALTQAIAQETQGTGITANVVLPSVIDTSANREAMGTDQADQWVKPTSLAHLIGFLASEAAGDIRGAAIPVYGDA
ncbi:3-oxoacyl-ACP reductase FabG [Almyronema epifaneia]|uniref:3-oxoacyl-ACP reductase FabG n=1 Tax=Almyronema epifaneia S1 TaxID=2991925 RepID=A0ABW6IHU5_9CYAN